MQWRNLCFPIQTTQTICKISQFINGQQKNSWKKLVESFVNMKYTQTFSPVASIQLLPCSHYGDFYSFNSFSFSPAYPLFFLSLCLFGLQNAKACEYLWNIQRERIHTQRSRSYICMKRTKKICMETKACVQIRFEVVQHARKYEFVQQQKNPPGNIKS